MLLLSHIYQPYTYIKILVLSLLSFSSLNCMHQKDALLWIQKGNIPVIITIPHGGSYLFKEIKYRTKGIFVKDLKTLELAEDLNKAIFDLAGKKPFIVGSYISRKHIDLNRSEKDAYEINILSRWYNLYHQTIQAFIQDINKSNKNGLLIDIHGQGAEPETIFLGTNNNETTKKFTDSKKLKANFYFANFFKNYNYHIVPSLETEQEDERFNGGFTVQHYGSHNEHGIDAFQLEFGNNLRTNEKKRKQLSIDIANILYSLLKEYNPTLESAA